MLRADDGHSVERFAAIPSPSDGRGVLRAAYSVPAAMIRPQTEFSLELEDGSLVQLPFPAPGGARPGQTGPEPDGSPVPEQTTPVASPPPAPPPEAEADARMAEYEAAVQERVGRLEQLLRQREAQNYALAAELAAQRDAHEKSVSAVSELEIWSGELERRLAATTDELSAAKMQLNEDEEELHRLRSELAEAVARAEAVVPASARRPRPRVGTAEAAAEIEALSARAEAEALELAARELAEAAEEARSRR